MRFTECDAPECTNRKTKRERWWRLSPLMEAAFVLETMGEQEEIMRDFCSIECVKAYLDDQHWRTRQDHPAQWGTV